MNKINKQKRNGFIHTANRLTAVRKEGVEGLGEKGEGIKKNLIDADNSMVITRRKGDWREVEGGLKGIPGEGRRLDLGW